MKLRVACIQYNPIIGEIEANKKKILSLLTKIPTVDLIVLPELSITGYNFHSRASITPFIDDGERNKVSTNFAIEVLKKYQCFTVIGLPQLVNEKLYNSCKIINPLGNEIHNYHKTFLYEADETWGCNENPDKSFPSVDIILNKEYYFKDQNKPQTNFEPITLNLGICMDLNPYKFEAPFNKFEFALSCYQNRSRLIICPMAWLSPFSPSLNNNLTSKQKFVEAQKYSQIIDAQGASSTINLESNHNPEFRELCEFESHQPDYSTVNYHLLRMFPFLNHEYNPFPKYGRVTMITCNRIGVESDVLYGGSSSMMQFNDVPGNDDFDHNNPSVDVLGYLPTGRQGVLYRELDV